MNCIDQVVTDSYTAINGDCVDALKGLPDHCIGYSIFSPPFASLYTYSNSPRDMGNVRNDAEFFEHFDFLIAELRRVMAPGRNVSFHCMDLPSSKERDGVIGLKDFPGDLIRAFQKHGFVFHSKVTIWKDPVTAMTRTKALGLLHKSIRERSEMCRQGIPDYLITMRAPGEVAEHVTHTVDEFPVSLWQQIAEAQQPAGRASVDDWERELSAVMPADFKDWWQNSRREWPAVAAEVIKSLRLDRDAGWEVAALAQRREPTPSPAPDCED
jgi:hypothetical protein